MRIALLTNDYPDAKATRAGFSWGAGRVAEEQVRILREASHDVRVWHMPFVAQEQPSWQRFLRHLEDRKPRKEVVKEILEWQPTLLLTHNLTGCGFGTPSLIQAHGVRWIHVLHDVQLFEPSGQMYSALDITVWQLFWGWLRSRSLGHPHMVISPTAWLLRKHRRRGFFLSDQFCVVYCRIRATLYV